MSPLIYLYTESLSKLAFEVVQNQILKDFRYNFILQKNHLSEKLIKSFNFITIINMNLIHLKYFFDAASLGSVSGAARVNFVSQSTISQAIGKLEQVMQVLLTTHQKHHFELTDEGKIVFEEAQKVFSSIEFLKDRVHELKGELCGEIKFACTHALAQFYLPPFYLKMRRLYPKIKLDFKRGSLEFIHESLRKRTVQFGIVLEAEQFQKYHCEVVHKGHFSFFQSKKLNEEKGIIISNETNPEIVQLKTNYKKKYGQELPVKDVLPDWSLVSIFAERGYGIGYLPDFMGKNSSSIEEINFNLLPCSYQIILIYNRGEVFPKAAQTFIDLLKS